MEASFSDPTDYDSLREIREFQLALITPVLPVHGRILEIGSGAGHQARALSKMGFDIEAIDVANCGYETERVWPVQINDGSYIPFLDSSFDAVFSSHVLEHIPDLWTYQEEIHRVLKPGGLAIHLLPTSSWRVTSLLFNYPFRLQSAARATIRAIGNKQSLSEVIERASPDSSSRKRLRRFLVAERHGAAGNFLSEIYLFSRFRWNKFFRETGWSVQEHSLDHVFCSGYYLLGKRLNVRHRRRLSRFMGSSSHIYVLNRSR
jgi:ubiquinone/menaquinone biosynthesis C-methylase UbiE